MRLTTAFYCQLILWCIIGLAPVQLAAQRVNVDSIRAVAAHPPNDTADLNALASLASLSRNEPDSLRYFALEAIRRARERGLDYWEARMNNSYAGQLAGFAGVNLDTAILYNQKALDFYESDTLIYRADLAAAYLNRGVFYYMQGDHANAVSYFEKAHDRMDPVKQAKNMASVMNNLGVLHRVMGDFEAAVRSYERSIELKWTINDSVGIASAQANMGVALMELDQHEEAFAAFQTAKEMQRSLGFKPAEIDVDVLIGLSYYNRGDVANTIRVWEEALSSPYLNALPRNMIQPYLGLADFYQDSLKNIDQAYKNIMEAQRYREAIAGNERLLMDLDFRLGLVYEEIGRVDSAAYYLKQYGLAARRIYNDDLLRYEQEMSERFQSRLQAAELERQDVRLALQDAEINVSQQRQRLLSVIVAGLGLLAMALWLVGRFRSRYQQAELARQELLQEQALERMQREGKLNELRSMIEGQEAERQRVAKDLHDGLGGLLSTVKANVGNLRGLVEKPVLLLATQPQQQKIPSSFDQAENLIDRACTEVRRIAHNMMPQTLSLSGLSGSLEDIAAQLTTQGLDCDLEITGQPEESLDEAQQGMVLRIVQELSQNVVKHAQATQILIQLLRQQEQILLIVEDNGKGFNTQYAEQTDKGLGLGSIKNRVTYLNGKLLIDSAPKRGTTVTINIPL